MSRLDELNARVIQDAIDHVKSTSFGYPAAIERSVKALNDYLNGEGMYPEAWRQDQASIESLTRGIQRLDEERQALVDRRYEEFGNGGFKMTETPIKYPLNYDKNWRGFVDEQWYVPEVTYWSAANYLAAKLFGHDNVAHCNGDQLHVIYSTLTPEFFGRGAQKFVRA